MKRLPMHAHHDRLGGVFGPIGDWELPLYYGDPEAEALRMRKTGGFMDRSFMGKLHVKGKDALQFLQGMVTNDLNLVSLEKGIYSLIVTIKGKIVADLTIYQLDEGGFLLILQPELTHPIQTLLDRYIIASQVEIQDVTDQWGILSLHGPRVTPLLEGILMGSFKDKEAYSVDSLLWRGQRVWIMPRFELGEKGFDLFTSVETMVPLWEEILEEGKKDEIFPFGSQTYEILRIEAGTPVFGSELDETVFPLEAGVDHAVNYDKGCYIGQETITRMKFRGRVNRHRIGFEVQGEELPKKGDRLFFEGKEVGIVSSTVFSPSLKKIIGMGYVRKEQSSSGTPLVLKGLSGQYDVTVSVLPFIGEGKNSFC